MDDPRRFPTQDRAIRRCVCLGVGFALAVLGSPLAAASTDLPPPTGDIILTITGEIDVHNAPDAAVFDLAILRDMPSETYRTTTLWTEGVQVFKGVLLETLLETVQISGTLIHARAINDYAIDIPVEDIEASRPLVAYENHGQEMSLRDKGPLWIVFPFDDGPEFQTEVNFARSIWQLDRIEVVTK